MKFQSIGGDKTADKNCVAYLEVTYPCKLNFSNRTMFDFTLPEVEKGDYILLEITNFNAGSSAPVLYCPEIQKRILASYIDGKYKILVPNQHKELKCILASQNAQSHVSEIKPIKSKNSPYTNQFFDFTAESAFIKTYDNALFLGRDSNISKIFCLLISGFCIID